MDINAEDFREHFQLLSDETLLATNRDDLVDAAKAVYDEELAHRGLLDDEETADAPDPVDGVETQNAPAESQNAAEHVVSVGSYTVFEEARLARGLLQSAGIPSGLENEKASMGALHLMVPASFEEAALQVLGGEISEEDLAAQAEAAGFDEESEPAETDEEHDEIEHADLKH